MGQPKRFSRNWSACNVTRKPIEMSFALASFTGRNDTPKVSATHEDLQYPPETHLPPRK
jgi:hypothetical protein